MSTKTVCACVMNLCIYVISKMISKDTEHELSSSICVRNGPLNHRFKWLIVHLIALTTSTETQIRRIIRNECNSYGRRETDFGRQRDDSMRNTACTTLIRDYRLFFLFDFGFVGLLVQPTQC